jgi:hypothetical protein
MELMVWGHTMPAKSNIPLADQIRIFDAAMAVENRADLARAEADRFGCTIGNIYYVIDKFLKKPEALATARRAVLAQGVDVAKPPQVELSPAPSRSSVVPPEAVPVSGMVLAGGSWSDEPPQFEKPGIALVIRPEDGEEQMLPFRRGEDALVELRRLARQVLDAGEQVWFTLRPVDLACFSEGNEDEAPQIA